MVCQFTEKVLEVSLAQPFDDLFSFGRFHGFHSPRFALSVQPLELGILSRYGFREMLNMAVQRSGRIDIQPAGGIGCRDCTAAHRTFTAQLFASQTGIVAYALCFGQRLRAQIQLSFAIAEQRLQPKLERFTFRQP